MLARAAASLDLLSGGRVELGPAPAHDIGIWVGAYKPRMLRLIGRQADGGRPSLGYVKHLDDLAAAR